MASENPILNRIKLETPFAQRFVRSWQAAGSMTDLLKRLEVPADAENATVHASAAASYLRRNGVELKDMPRVRTASAKMDFAGLNALASEPAKEETKAPTNVAPIKQNHGSAPHRGAK